jgi:hypothetical protein
MPTQDTVRLIETAFASTPSPGADFDNISATKQDEGIVEYFRGTTWRGHTVRALRYHCAALSFFTDPAFRYWLPAFMLASLEDPVTADVIPESIESSMRKAEKLALFTVGERHAISAFLYEFAVRFEDQSFYETAKRVRRSAGEA